MSTGRRSEKQIWLSIASEKVVKRKMCVWLVWRGRKKEKFIFKSTFFVDLLKRKTLARVCKWWWNARPWIMLEMLRKGRIMESKNFHISEKKEAGIMAWIMRKLMWFSDIFSVPVFFFQSKLERNNYLKFCLRGKQKPNGRTRKWNSFLFLFNFQAVTLGKCLACNLVTESPSFLFQPLSAAALPSSP